MDIACPITAVVPTLEGPVLTALAGTSTPVTLSEVARLAGRGSPSGVLKALRRLVATGLVHVVPGGYLLNREHLAAPAVLSLATLHGEFLNRLRNLVSPWADRVALVGLFGSTARRDGGPDSDIDLLVVADGDVEDLTDHLVDRVQTWTGNNAQVLVLTPSQFAQLKARREPLAHNLDQDLVVLAGGRNMAVAV